MGAALEAAANSIVITKRDGTISWVNPAFVKSSGYSAEEVIGQTPRLLRSGKHPPEFYTGMWKTILANQVWTGEVTNRKKDGRLYMEEMTITPVPFDSGEDVYFVAVKQDVTERKSLEDQFRQAQKMEAVGRLAGGIAHDFNNLLGVIGGYTESLADQIGDDPALVSVAAEIKTAVKSAAALTSQLLTFSRKEVCQPRIISMNKIVSDTTSMLRRLLGEDISLNLLLDPETGNVKADPGQLQQVIMNLAVNARDAMPRGGSLTIETSDSNLQVGQIHQDIFVPAGRYARLTLRDTGVGMDADTQRRAFEPFFTTKQKEHGTGLGLSTVFGIVRQSGGYVSLSSKLGEGTIAVVHLARVNEESSLAVEEVRRRHQRSSHATILLVEDYQSLRDVVRNSLLKSGYTVLIAANGPEALSMVGSHEGPIHLLITDAIMPGMDGRELAERISELKSGIGVLYMSGYTGEMLGHHGAIDANTPFIKKPFEMADFMAKVQEGIETRNRRHTNTDSPAA